jgi:hypothetical protein
MEISSQKNNIFLHIFSFPSQVFVSWKRNKLRISTFLQNNIINDKICQGIMVYGIFDYKIWTITQMPI